MRIKKDFRKEKKDKKCYKIKKKETDKKLVMYMEKQRVQFSKIFINQNGNNNEETEKKIMIMAMIMRQRIERMARDEKYEKIS